MHVFLYFYKFACIFVGIQICIHVFQNLPAPACRWSEGLPDCHKASQWAQPSTWTLHDNDAGDDDDDDDDENDLTKQ